MADGIKARLQRFNLFNTKQEQKYVSLFCVKDCRSVLFSFRLMLSGKLTLAHSHRSEYRTLKLASLVSINVIFYSLYKLTFWNVLVCIGSEYKPLLFIWIWKMIHGFPSVWSFIIHSTLIVEQLKLLTFYAINMTITGQGVMVGKYPGMVNISATV